MNKVIRLLSVVASLSIMWSCGNTSDKDKSMEPHCVYSAVPIPQSADLTSYYTSTVEEGKSVNAGFKTGGQIKRLTVREGDYVSKGQIIGFLDETDYALSLKQLETQFAQVSSENKRIEEMHRHGNVSDNDYEKAKAGLEQLKIQLDLTKNQLSYTRLTAPVAGHIVERFMEEGEMVGAGTPVYKIVDNSGVEASVALPANAYSKKNQIVRCIGRSSVTGDKEIPLDIISFIPDGDNNSLFRLRLKIPDSYRNELLPGMNLSVEILYNSASGADTYLIPSRALFEREGKTYVWVIAGADSHLTAREVRVVGAPDGKYSQVSGLGGNDVIVAAGVHHLYENQKVKVIGKIDDLKEKAAL